MTHRSASHLRRQEPARERGGRGVRQWAWPAGPGRGQRGPCGSSPRPQRLPRGPGPGPPGSRRPAVRACPPAPPMAGKLLSLLPPALLAAAGLAGLLLLCVPTRDVREPPTLKVLLGLRARGARRAGPGAAGCARASCAPWLPRPSPRCAPGRRAESPPDALRSAPGRAWVPGPWRRFRGDAVPEAPVWEAPACRTLRSHQGRW